jgi:hypothetical protein
MEENLVSRYFGARNANMRAKMAPLLAMWMKAQYNRVIRNVSNATCVAQNTS